MKIVLESALKGAGNIPNFEMLRTTSSEMTIMQNSWLMSSKVDDKI